MVERLPSTKSEKLNRLPRVQKLIADFTADLKSPLPSKREKAAKNLAELKNLDGLAEYFRRRVEAYPHPDDLATLSAIEAIEAEHPAPAAAETPDNLAEPGDPTQSGWHSSREDVADADLTPALDAIAKKDAAAAPQAPETSQNISPEAARDLEIKKQNVERLEKGTDIQIEAHEFLKALEDIFHRFMLVRHMLKTLEIKSSKLYAETIPKMIITLKSSPFANNPELKEKWKKQIQNLEEGLTKINSDIAAMETGQTISPPQQGQSAPEAASSSNMEAVVGRAKDLLNKYISLQTEGLAEIQKERGLTRAKELRDQSKTDIEDDEVADLLHGRSGEIPGEIAILMGKYGSLEMDLDKAIIAKEDEIYSAARANLASRILLQEQARKALDKENNPEKAQLFNNQSVVFGNDNKAVMDLFEGNYGDLPKDIQELYQKYSSMRSSLSSDIIGRTKKEAGAEMEQVPASQDSQAPTTPPEEKGSTLTDRKRETKEDAFAHISILLGMSFDKENRGYIKVLEASNQEQLDVVRDAAQTIFETTQNPSVMAKCEEIIREVNRIKGEKGFASSQRAPEGTEEELRARQELDKKYLGLLNEWKEMMDEDERKMNAGEKGLGIVGGSPPDLFPFPEESLTLGVKEYFDHLNQRSRELWGRWREMQSAELQRGAEAKRSESPQREAVYSTDFIKTRITELLKSVTAIKEIRTVEVLGSINSILLGIYVVAEKGIKMNIGIKATIRDAGGKLAVENIQIDAPFGTTGFVKGLITPHLDNLTEILKADIEKLEPGARVEKIEIMEGQLKVTFMDEAKLKAEQERAAQAQATEKARREAEEARTREAEAAEAAAKQRGAQEETGEEGLQAPVGAIVKMGNFLGFTREKIATLTPEERESVKIYTQEQLQKMPDIIERGEINKEEGEELVVNFRKILEIIGQMEDPARAEKAKVIETLQATIREAQRILDENAKKEEELLRRLAELRAAREAQAGTPEGQLAQLEAELNNTSKLRWRKRIKLEKKIATFEQIIDEKRSREEKLKIDEERNPFKYHIIRKMGDKNVRIIFSTDRENLSVEEINNVMSKEGKKVMFWNPNYIIEERENTVSLSSNGFYLKILNKDEVREKGKIMVDNPKAVYELYHPDGRKYQGTFDYRNGQRVLHTEAGKYQREELAGFEANFRK